MKQNIPKKDIDLIIHVRKRWNLNQKKLADAMGLGTGGQVHVSRMESGTAVITKNKRRMLQYIWLYGPITD